MGRSFRHQRNHRTAQEASVSAGTVSGVTCAFLGRNQSIVLGMVVESVHLCIRVVCKDRPVASQVTGDMIGLSAGTVTTPRVHTQCTHLLLQTQMHGQSSVVTE